MREGRDGAEDLLRPPHEKGLTPRLLGLLAALLTAAGCLGPVPTLYPPGAGEPTRTLWVLGHGWHTSIVARRADISSTIWPEHEDFPQARFIEVAWGDRDFYQAERGTLWLALKAALGSASVLHVVGISTPIAEYFPETEIVELTVSQRGFDELSRFIHASYARDATGRTTKTRRGHYGQSSFYLATETYHLFNTCNTWVAKALRAAGLPITPAYAMTAGNVMRQVRELGTVRRERSPRPPAIGLTSPGARARSRSSA